VCQGSGELEMDCWAVSSPTGRSPQPAVRSVSVPLPTENACEKTRPSSDDLFSDWAYAFILLRLGAIPKLVSWSRPPEQSPSFRAKFACLGTKDLRSVARKRNLPYQSAGKTRQQPPGSLPGVTEHPNTSQYYPLQSDFLEMNAGELRFGACKHTL
jgi:hypothetical protein